MIDDVSAVDVNVIITRHFILHVKERTRRNIYFIKVAAHEFLKREYKGLSIANDGLRPYVPKAVAFGVEQGLSILVCESERVDILRPRHLSPRRSMITRDLFNIFAKTVDVFSVTDKGPAHTEILLDKLRDIGDRDVKKAMTKHLDRMDISEIDRTLHISQHGDFVMRNLGIRRSTGGVVVFDWEDFGRVTLAGMDVATFLASSVHFDSKKILAILSRKDATVAGDLYVAAMKILGIDLALTKLLFPIYMVHFLDLKINLKYSDDVVSRVNKTICELCDGISGG